MKVGRAFFAGIVGGAATTLIMTAAHTAGASADVMQLLGTLPGNAPSSMSWLVGFLVITVTSGLIGIAYGAAFETITRSAGVATGLKVSLVHTALAGIFVGLLGMMHPLVPETMRAPGFFMSKYGGLGILAFVVGHLVFGAIVGGLYGAVTTEDETTPFK
ncbi:hypothetical protein [Polyangium jinanense]|uniref:Uncharacterized protein n=1 Tax=Polyangium jinanense TaxID=2829994 RepID=A0A9X4AUJ7_9BACT|nr:hypothetical protein [Polyangium jinanense]MDC3960858.1 hypothetical protein [Polyangium jinanense]MDC3984681.1 hypothetical protein [Polyangium jinanense]